MVSSHPLPHERLALHHSPLKTNPVPVTGSTPALTEIFASINRTTATDCTSTLRSSPTGFPRSLRPTTPPARALTTASGRPATPPIAVQGFMTFRCL